MIDLDLEYYINIIDLTFEFALADLQFCGH